MKKKHPQKILYIEDDPASTAVIDMLLDNYDNLSLITSWSAEEGVKLAEEHCPAMVFVDINLPRMSGNEAACILKSNPKLENTKIVAISSNVKPEQIKKTMDCGFDGYITKPVDLTKIIELIENL